MISDGSITENESDNSITANVKNTNGTENVIKKLKFNVHPIHNGAIIVENVSTPIRIPYSYIYTPSSQV